MIGDRPHVSRWCRTRKEGSQVLLEDFREKQRLWHVELRLVSPFLTDLLPQHLSHTDCTVYHAYLQSRGQFLLIGCLWLVFVCISPAPGCHYPLSEDLSSEIVFQKTASDLH